MAGSERSSIYCLCNLLQIKKIVTLSPFQRELVFLFGSKPQRAALQRAGSAVSHPHPAARQPLPAFTPTQPELPQKGLRTLDTGWRAAGGIGMAGEILFGFEPANTSSSSE